MTDAGASLPLGSLEYLYVGTSRFEDDLAFYRDVLGAELVWNFEKFGARVAAFRVAAGPLLLIADHRPAKSCMPVFGVTDIEATISALRARGFVPLAGPFGIPDGPCYLFADRSGNQLAVFGNERPNVLVAAYHSQQKSS